jgi:sec-independent protein translocase protein TatC
MTFMVNFFRKLSGIVAYPFRLLWRIASFPFRLMGRFVRFMNTEPGETPVIELIGGIVTDAAIRRFLLDEIQAFRMHLLRMVIILALGIVGSFFFTQKLIAFLAQPIGGLDALRAIEVTESIGVFMKVALLSGIIITLPYQVFELWWFAAPGLRPREKKVSLWGIPLATIFFVGGVAFTYFVLLPSALPFLLSFMGIQAVLRPQSYFTFITGLMLWIGLIFELPLLIYMLTAIGLVTPKGLFAQWRLAVVIIAILAAAITPTVDPVNMFLVMAPMTLLYFISIGFSSVAHAGRMKDKAKQEKEKQALEAKEAIAGTRKPKPGKKRAASKRK